jgi:hypothetical protein
MMYPCSHARPQGFRYIGQVTESLAARKIGGRQRAHEIRAVADTALTLGRVADGSLGSLEVFRSGSFLDKVLVSLVILRLSGAKAAKIANAATLPPRDMLQAA